jgi:hypothetical protein
MGSLSATVGATGVCACAGANPRTTAMAEAEQSGSNLPRCPEAD